MANQVKKIQNLFIGFNEFWKKQTKKGKLTLISILVGVLVVAIVGSVMLNNKSNGFVVLYSGLDAAESTKIYQALVDLEVPAQLDSSGQILVPEERKDKLLIELSALGYPKSAPSYDIFTSNAGLTTTEFEKKQYLIFQLQDRIEKTIMHIEGVQSAIVTLVIPEDSSYVWQDNAEDVSTASILITMEGGSKLSASHISAVKNLVASSVPKMSVDNVTIVDALTSLEMHGNDENSDDAYSASRLDFETQMEQKIVEKAKNVLSLSYGEDKLRVSATVVIDYSKMITEQMDYIPGEDGNGVKGSLSESYKMDASDVASGVAGEESNTDVPIYVDNNNDGVPETVYHVRDIDYFVSYVKQQIEKDNTQLVSASLAVSVADTSLTEEKRTKIISLVSDATNVQEANITVVNLLSATSEDPVTTPDSETPTTEPTTDLTSLLNKYLPYIIAAGGILLLLLIVIIILRKKFKKNAKVKTKSRPDDSQEQEETLEGIAQHDADMQRRKLRDAALASVSRENAVSDEVREFANENPEITASLIRAWLKEGE